VAWNALLIGLGQIGMGYDMALAPETFVYSHARALSLHPAFNLVGAVDSGMVERSAFQDVYHAPAYSTIEQALDAHDADLVVIATPTMTHNDLLHKILDCQAPKAILCEKPLAYSLEESQEMLSLCAEKKVPLYVNYIRRSEPGALEVKRRIDCGEISGPVKGLVWYAKGFLHNASHSFNLLQYWLGKVKSFSIINAGRSLPHDDAEPDVRVVFEKGDMVFLAAKDENFSHNTIELIAANGRLRYESGGQCIEWNAIATDANLKSYTFLAEHVEEIPSKLNRYQWHVMEELAIALKNQPAHLCDGVQAFKTINDMHSILRSR
jgi:predicted dehydrogenase